MKIPLNWLKSYVKIPVDLKKLTDALTMAGHMLDKIETVNGEMVIDLELRGNRADCYSVMGIAREVSALFQTPFKYPKIYPALKMSPKASGFVVDIKSPYVKRVTAVVLKNVTIAPSPKWLKDRLEAYGIPAINNIVDLTNYVMLETGEPMHAFDLDKVGKNLTIRLAKKGEVVTTFLGQNISLTPDDLVWANSEAILSVAGAIGGKYHSISDATTTVLLEAATYDRANIRRTIYRHNILTDAGIRHEKELDPNLVEEAVRRYLELIVENSWGKPAIQAFDFYPKPVKPWKLHLAYDFLYTLGGLEVDPKRVREIFTWLNFKIVKKSAEGIEVLIPTYRTDVVSDEDLVEEVLRIEGYDKIPAKTLSLEIPQDVTPAYIVQELDLKNRLLALGFDELISSPFVSEKSAMYNKPLADKGEAVHVVNFPSPDTEVLRTSMLPNLLEAAMKIVNERGTLAQLFEIGKIYLQAGGKYVEKRKLGMIYWSKEELGFVKFKGLVDGFLTQLGLLGQAGFSLFDTGSPLINTFTITAGNEVVGAAGAAGQLFYAEFDLDALLGKCQKTSVGLWPKYPPQIEDVTLSVPVQTHIGEIVGEMKKPSLINTVELMGNFDNSYTFRIWYQNPKKTLTDEEVKKVREGILGTLEKKFGVHLKG